MSITDVCTDIHTITRKLVILYRCAYYYTQYINCVLKCIQLSVS